MKLLLDEMYPALITGELRARRHDVLSVHEAPGSGAPDADVFAFAQSDQRVIVTENVQDFRPLAEEVLRRGERHYGVIFTTSRRWPRSNPGRLIAALDSLLASTPEQPRDMEFWL